MASKKTAPQEVEAIVVPPIAIKSAVICIVGDSPLICHAWDDKAKLMLWDPDAVKDKKHEPRNPVRSFINSLYWLEGKPEEDTEEAFDAAIRNGARFGFPSVALKDCAVSGGYRAGILPNKVSGYAGFHVPGELVEVQGVPHIREDMVRVGQGKADIRWRGEFSDWRITFTVNYNSGVFSIAHIINLFNHGGYAVGIGEWRPERGGSNGMFHCE